MYVNQKRSEIFVTRAREEEKIVLPLEWLQTQPTRIFREVSRKIFSDVWGV